MAARTHSDFNLPGLDEAEFCRLCYAAAWFDELAHQPGEEHKILSFIGASDFKDLDDILAVVPRRLSRTWSHSSGSPPRATSRPCTLAPALRQ